MLRSLTHWILLALGLGALFGAALNTWADPASTDWSRVWITEGALYFLGQGFIALLKMLVVPMVFVSITAGTASLDDIRKLGRIGVQTLALYLSTTAVAISIAIALTVFVRPGAGFVAGVSLQATPTQNAPGLLSVLLGIVPSNPIQAMAEGNMLQVIVFSGLLGLAITQAGEAGRRVLSLFEDLNTIVLKLVGLVMWIAPIGVFALIARTLATQGLDALLPLIGYFGCVLGALALHGFGVYALLLKGLGRLPVRPFYRKMREAQIFAFSTASSGATIPVTQRTVETQLGVPRPIAAFSIPLGATINMDGTAIMQGVATVFLAEVYGVALGPTEYAMVVVTATLASIGTASVPGVGLVMLTMVLNQVRVPVEGIALVMGVDRLLDMTRTAMNITGDAVVACIVSRKEGLDVDRYLADDPAP